jgi:hypothetical protein
MSTPKLQPSKALRISSSNTIEIPYPSPLSSGNNTSVTASKLVCSTATFITNGVKIGDVVYNNGSTNPTIATVTAVDSQTQLSLSANIFTAQPVAFVVYPSSASAGRVDSPILYIGAGGTVVVETDGGDIVAFVGAPAGSILPVMVRKVLASGAGTTTTATNINALW